MSYQGKNLVVYYEPFDIDIKLMTCLVFKWPLLVEIEKTAKTEEDAREYERDLQELSHRFQLQNHLLREEPASLLNADLTITESRAD